MENNQELLLSFFGLMRRAGALTAGAEAAFDACRLKKARLLCLTADAARNTASAAANGAEEGNVPTLRLPFGKKAVGEAIGMAECAVLAVCDTGFALALCQKLGKTELAAELELKLQREKRRKQKKLAGKPTGNKASEKRGKRV